jgi:BatD DUF11 like domain
MHCKNFINRALRILVTHGCVMPLCVFAAVLLLDPPPLSAKNAVVQATIDTNRTTIDTPVSLSVTIAADRGEVDTSPIKDFKIISRSTSSSIQIINGNVNRQRILTYMLLPLKEGKLIIPSLSVAIDGKKSYTEPIVVHVSKGMATAEASAGIRISGRVNDVHPYLGQQIVYTFRLLYGVQITNTNYEAPSFEGFSATQIGKQKTGQTIINGRPFQEVTISYLLVPLKTGPITIGPATLQCDTMHPRPGDRSMFDSFFSDPFFSNSQPVPKVFRTSEISIRVLPLPEWTGPEAFSGLVGQFDMKAELETHKTSVGNSVTLSVTLEGKGNLQDAETPQFHVPDAFKQYADQPEIHVQLEPDGYVGRKVFKTALVPVKAGSYTLTTAAMVYFDPKAKAYRRLSVAPLSLMVRKSGEAAEAAPEVSPPDTRSNEPALIFCPSKPVWMLSRTRIRYQRQGFWVFLQHRGPFFCLHFASLRSQKEMTARWL